LGQGIVGEKLPPIASKRPKSSELCGKD